MTTVHSVDDPNLSYSILSGTTSLFIDLCNVYVRVGRADIVCPITECSGYLEESLVVSHLGSEEVAKYKYFLELSRVDSSTKPCPQCSQFTSLKGRTPSKADHKYKIQCTKCQFVWCFKCQAPWHDGLKCRDYRKGDKLLRHWASVIEHGQRNAQKCPRCKIHIQRTEGCDHMNCTQCSTNFCYRCGEKYRHLRFFGDHTSNLSVFGCKYRYLPEKPHLRRLVRGSVCAVSCCIYVKALFQKNNSYLLQVANCITLLRMETRQQGLLDPEPLTEVDEEMVSEVDLYNTVTDEEREEILSELTKLEEEISTLRQVLASKEKHHSDLKAKLGITPLSELKQNFNRSWYDMQTSTAGEEWASTVEMPRHTSSISSLYTNAKPRQQGQVNSPSFKSFEEKVESTVSNIKTKVGSQGGGGSFEEVLSSAAHASAQETPSNNLSESSDHERTC
ncbi:unnamed protein product [Oncorhynchus mykiss]|uniref:RING-type domain-containing protein n=1 Tax=Oncorhynchus mykiss TaxID=8022 RepID=A0A060VWT9_ONCMY|nr:unnamed protein product [Oncorhynchus mykiss]